MAASSDPERVLAEALQVMAGGDLRAASSVELTSTPGAETKPVPLQLIHLVLLAAIIGVLVGTVAALVLA